MDGSGLNSVARTNKCVQTEVSALSPRVAFLDHQRSLLTLGNSHLRQRIAALAQDKIFKDGDRHCRPPLPLPTTTLAGRRRRNSIRAACIYAIMHAAQDATTAAG
jgi:hypothetical protein